MAGTGATAAAGGPLEEGSSNPCLVSGLQCSWRTLSPRWDCQLCGLSSIAPGGSPGLAEEGCGEKEDAHGLNEWHSLRSHTSHFCQPLLQSQAHHIICREGGDLIFPSTPQALESDQVCRACSAVLLVSDFWQYIYPLAPSKRLSMTPFLMKAVNSTSLSPFYPNPSKPSTL